VGSRGRGFRTFVVEGFEILVGTGDAENDALTLGVAARRDLWLHAASTPGSHVVVRHPDDLDELPPPVLDQAATLAAWHSKARDRRGKVEVHVCRAADVSKPRHAPPPGEVRLRRWQSVRVYPRPPASS
jgi:predicted ribosome quality control (RQC) complex YloA/Tae2 family protein